MPFTPVTIRSLKSRDDCRLFQLVQSQIWVGDPTDMVPIHVLVTQAKNGGMLLGAFAEDGPEESERMVGIAFGWPGLVAQNGEAPRLKFCSHIVGVLPAWHGQGIGLQLKLAQRERLLEQGIMTLATWTYDPLQRINGIFNIHRLGATCATYLRNVYGEMDDHLNVGLPTDRFQVDWQMDSARVERALAASGLQGDWFDQPLIVAETREVANRPGLREPVVPLPRPTGDAYALPLPASVSALRDESLDLLLAWRFFVREGAEAAFAADYVLVDCVELPGRSWHYLFVPTDRLERL